MTEEVEAIVIDNGSGILKAGLWGNEEPDIEIPSVVGNIRLSVGNGNESYVGNEAHRHSSILNVKHSVFGMFEGGLPPMKTTLT